MNGIVYFNGKYIPYSQASIPIGTHAFNYGTGCFEGIRGYFNDEKLFLFRLRDHYARMQNSAKTLRMKLPLSLDELCNVTIELVRRNKYKENIYIRPILYKTHEGVGKFNLTKLNDGFCIFTQPLGHHYVDVNKGIKAMTSSWYRINSKMIPPFAKPTGGYLNTCLAKTEAEEKGYDEAILLNVDNSVAEGSAENIFIVKNNKLITPSQDQNILVGITRDTVISVAKKELGIMTEERKVSVEELYSADEVFVTGTGAEITIVNSINDKDVSKEGNKVSKQIQNLYFDIVNGKIDKYKKWLFLT